MAHIKITKGLDIPIEGAPSGEVKPFIRAGEASPLRTPGELALTLREFGDIKFRLLAKVGDEVTIGQPLAEDKSTPGRMFVSPAAGTVKEVRRGLKRSLQELIITVAAKEEHYQRSSIDVQIASRETLTQYLLEGGSFASIRSRPFGFLADPNKVPHSIFVKALESAPFTPSAELQVAGHEVEFQTGLDVLAKLTDGKVHLVYRQGTVCRAFLDAEHVEKHTAEGPHPISNYSVHIQKLAPIRSADDCVWTLSVRDVIGIGTLLAKGTCDIEQVVSIAGPGVLPNRTGYFKIRRGIPVKDLISGRIAKGSMRLISGDPLMGQKVEEENFLGFYQTVFCVIPESSEREFLHFFRAGIDKYSFSKAYVSGHFDNKGKTYPFTTCQHGEHRAFIDSTLYDKVMPLTVPTMLLAKAVMAEDFELADTLGLLEVDSEDFALPTFVCPSKMEMVAIIKKGLKQYASEILE